MPAYTRRRVCADSRRVQERTCRSLRGTSSLLQGETAPFVHTAIRADQVQEHARCQRHNAVDEIGQMQRDDQQRERHAARPGEKAVEIEIQQRNEKSECSDRNPPGPALNEQGQTTNARANAAVRSAGDP